MAQGGPELRQELRDILSTLHAQIQADGSRGLNLHRSSAHVAEMSCIRALVALAARALTGAELAEDASFMGLGQLRDARDAASLTARDMKLQRDAAEQQLAALTAPLLPGIDALLSDESRCTTAVDGYERRHAQQLAVGLTRCAGEISELLLAALSSAAPRGTCAAERVRIGQEALVRIEGVARAWLQWYLAVEPGRSSVPGIAVPQQVVARTLQDSAAASYVRQLRQCMHLRRQQARLIAILTRIAAASTIGELHAALTARIVLL